MFYTNIVIYIRYEYYTRGTVVVRKIDKRQGIQFHFPGEHFSEI